MAFSQMIEGISDLAVKSDGKILLFAIQTKRGEKIPLACPIDHFEKIIEDLLHLAIDASNQRSPQEIKAAIPKGRIYGKPILTLQFGIGPGIAPNEVHLSFHLGILNLTFSVATRQLKGLHEAIARMVPVKRPPAH